MPVIDRPNVPAECPTREAVSGGRIPFDSIITDRDRRTEVARGGACVFCGKFVRKLSREHIWSDWMQHYLPAGLPGHSERWSTAEGRERWEQPLLKVQVRAPCKQCNNGWMADIEKAAAPIVGPMIQGTRLLLDASAQQKVATWAVLKAMVTTRTSPKQES